MGRGELRVYVGVAPGAGTTCAMLAEGGRRAARGASVWIGPVDTHGRPVTTKFLADLQRLGRPLPLDGSIPRAPGVVVIDDLAAVDGATHRWQRALRLAAAGLDVVATVRVDEIDSLSDVAASIRGVPAGDTVPDHVLKAASQLEVVDVTPEALRRRLAHGNVVDADRLDAATAASFELPRLHRLRELALEWMADRAEEAADRFRDQPAVRSITDEDSPSIAVVIDPRFGGERAIRRAARLADRLGARLVGIHVSKPSSGGAAASNSALEAQQRLVVDLGGDLRSSIDGDISAGLVAAAVASRASQLVVPSGPRVISRLVRAANLERIDLHIVPDPSAPRPRRSWSRLSIASAIVAIASLGALLVVLPHRDVVAVTSLIALTVTSIWATAITAQARRRAGRAQHDAAVLVASARTLVVSPDPVPALLAEVVSALAVSGAAVITPSESGPIVEHAVGEPVTLGAPAAAADVDRSGCVLATAGRRLDGDDLRILRGFAAQVGAARQHGALHAEARQAVVLAEVDALRAAILRAVSHDLHTPLAGIKASVTSLRQGDVQFDADQRRELLATIETETDRLNRMVTNLLDVSRLEAGALHVELRPTFLEDVVAATLANVAHRPERLEIAVPETVPAVLADPALLERTLANLVSNALAWSPVDVPVRIDAGSAGSDVRLRVIDRGPGIPAAERERVLMPFQRLGHKSLQAGAGLGLTVAAGFVEAIGGRLLLDDTPGGGLTATIALRVAPDAEPSKLIDELAIAKESR